MHKESVYSHISWSIQTDHRGQENPSFSRLKSTAHAIPTSLLKASGWYHMLLYIQINNLKANIHHFPGNVIHLENPGAFLLLQIQYQLTQTQ